jgi:hypothetical protein
VGNTYQHKNGKMAIKAAIAAILITIMAIRSAGGFVPNVSILNQP